MNTEQAPNKDQYSGYYPQPLFREGEGIDIKRYLSLFLSNWYWFAIALFISLSIAYGINRYSEKVYTVSSTLLIKDDQFGGGMSGMERFVPGGDIFRSNQNLQNEMGILKSYSLNYKAMKQLPDFWVTYTSVGRRRIAETRMYKNCPFTVYFDTLSHQSRGTQIDINIESESTYNMQIGEGKDTIMNFGDIYSSQRFNFALVLRNDFKYYKEASNHYYFRFESIESLANRYRGRLNISPIQDEASLVTLSVSGYSALQEADYLNMLMEVYIADGLEQKNLIADNTIEFISDQLGLITDSLTKAEDKLEQFLTSNSLINLSSEGALIQSRLERFETEKYDLELQKQYYQYLKEYIDNRDNSGDIISPAIMGVTDPNLSRLVIELASLQQQKQHLAFSLSEDLPAFSHINGIIENIRNSLKEIVRSGIDNLTLLIERNEKKIDEIEIQINKLPETERNFIRIQRKFDLNNSVYTYLLEKRAEAGIAKASNVSDNRIIDNALSFNSYRIKPKTRQNNTMAFIFGLLIPFVLIIIIDYLNNKIVDKKDVIKGTNVPVIGLISHNSSKSELPVIDNPRSSLAESFRSVRTSLKYLKTESNTPVISITSTISSEGKTFIAVNMASVFALLGKKTLLVGLDLRKPRIHKILDTGNSTGLSNYLIGESDFDDVVSETEYKNLYYAASGPIPPNPAELIESQRMAEFIKRAREEFDYIILDTPPLAIVTDALLLEDHVDITLLVVRQRYTSRNTLSLIQELYDKGRLNNPGIVLNDINLSGYYGYGLRYGYSFGYGYSYGYDYYGQYGYRNSGYNKEGFGYYIDNN